MSSAIAISKLSPLQQAACKAAVAVSKRSYSPYSNFCVGAALMHPDDTVTEGTNWENCTYQGTCAERCAIVRANAIGKRAAIGVAVYGAVKDSVPQSSDLAITTPCGLCRQMLYEVSQITGVKDFEVIMVTRSTTHAVIKSLSTLLPDAFGPEDAGLSISAFKLQPPQSKL
jgi:cytidine deaminase